MGIKMPQFRSCCSCLSLRTCLLTLGYTNLISHGVTCFVVFYLASMLLAVGGGFPPLEWALLLPLVMGSEVVFYILVVAATHKKDARLLKVTLIVGTALWIFTVMYSICLTYRLGRVLRRIDWNDTSSDDDFKFGICITVSAVILDPIILGYVLLLVRSLKSMIRAETPGLRYRNFDGNIEARADYERTHSAIIAYNAKQCSCCRTFSKYQESSQKFPDTYTKV